MCFDHDSRPPIAPIAGGALDGMRSSVTSGDGTEFSVFRARPMVPSGAAVLILPDVRGLHPFYDELSLRFAEHGHDALAIDYFGRTAGLTSRDAEFEFAPHVTATTWAGISSDIRAGAAALRADGLDRLFTIGFCMGGRMSFLAPTLGLDLAGVMGLYGTLVGPWRNDAPEPVAMVPEYTTATPVLGLFGGADPAIPAEHIAAFEAAFTDATIPHRLVTYPDAPHSFFDRKATDYAEESAASWDEVLAFIADPGAAAS